MKKRIATVCIFASLLGQIGTAFAELPANEYACKVKTNSGHTGLVMVQADDASIASKAAGRGNATRLDGVAEQVKVVVECIPFPQQRFSDSALQAFIDTMPR